MRRLTALVTKVSNGHSGEEKARAFHVAAEQIEIEDRVEGATDRPERSG